METCWIRRGNIGIGNGVIRDSLWGQYLWSYTQHGGERGETYVTRFRIFFLYSELISNRLSQYSDTGVNNDFRQRWSGFLTFLKNRFHVPPSSYFRLDRFHVFPLRRSCHFSLESLLRSTWIYQTWEEVPDFSNEGIERIISLSSLSLLSIYFE